MNGLCSIGRYNEQPMVSAWNMFVKFKDTDFMGTTPLKDVLIWVEQNGYRDEFLLWCGKQNGLAEYLATPETVMRYWGVLLLLIVVFTIASVVALEFIDRDQR